MKDPYLITKEDSGFLKILTIILRSVWFHYRWKFLQFVFTAVLAGLLLTIAPKILQQIIDLLLKGSGWSTSFTTLLMAYGLCLFGGAVFRFAASKVSFYIATQVEDRWRYVGLQHYYDLQLAWHDQHDSGEIGSKIDKGGSAIFVIIYELMGHSLMVSFVTLILVLLYTIWNYPFISALLIFPIPIYILVTYFLSQKIVAGQGRLNIMAEDASRTLYDGVANVRAVKAFGKEKEETQNYAKRWSGYHNFEYGVERLWFTQDFCQTTIETVMRTLVLAYCIYAAFNGLVTVGEVILIVNYQQMTFAPLAQLNQLFTRIRRNIKRTAQLGDIIAEEDKLKDKPKAIAIKPLRKEIRLENVHFEYSGRIAALHDLNICIPAGTTTALVGRSGAGKSTLALLLMRFYDPEEGRIIFDGIDLRDIKKASLRKHIAWIPQDTCLFNRTIKENIGYGKKNVTLEEIETAARLAHAHDFIIKTTKGYLSLIGERGVKLSGGQRQRIAIARALLTKPSLVIMDEATSHLDSETEKAISESIRALHHKTTQLIIAHRLSTILHADQIVVLDKGRIVAAGRHEELMKNPTYHKLYTLQFHKRE